jgi:hypothetical protein
MGNSPYSFSNNYPRKSPSIGPTTPHLKDSEPLDLEQQTNKTSEGETFLAIGIFGLFVVVILCLLFFLLL